MENFEIIVGSFLELRNGDRLLVCSKKKTEKGILVENVFVNNNKVGQKYCFTLGEAQKEFNNKEKNKDYDVMRISLDFDFKNVIWYLEEEVSLTEDEDKFLDILATLFNFELIVKDRNNLHLLNGKKETIATIHLREIPFKFEALEEREIYDYSI